MGANLSGLWRVNDGGAPYNVELTQAGDRVTGKYTTAAGDYGTIDGALRGNEFQFRWDQPTNQRGGSGRLVPAADGSMSGTWAYDPSAYGSGLTGHGTWSFHRVGDPALGRVHNWLTGRLIPRGYSEIDRVAPLAWGFLKPAHGLYVTALIGVVDARRLSETPEQTFARLGAWYQQKIGGIQGTGLLLFLYFRPAATQIDVIKQSRFYANYIPVAVAALDLEKGAHWPEYLGEWQSVLFDS